MTDSSEPPLWMQDVLQAELQPGETVLWSQQPRPFEFARRALDASLFGVVFLIMAVCIAGAEGRRYNAERIDRSDPFSARLVGSLFVVAGAVIAMSPVWGFLKALRTIYAITDRRAILMASVAWPTVHSFTGRKLFDTHRVEKSGGRGDIVFHREARSGRHGEYYYDVGFLDIVGAREAEAMLRELYARTRPPPNEADSPQYS